MLYHYELGFPKGFNSRVGEVPVQYSAHALKAANTDRYGLIKLPRTIQTNSATCIELEMEQGRAVKLVYRMSYNDTLDIVFVCAPQGSSFKVLTVWLNLKTDKHATLDSMKYKRVA